MFLAAGGAIGSAAIADEFGYSFGIAKPLEEMPNVEEEFKQLLWEFNSEYWNVGFKPVPPTPPEDPVKKSLFDKFIAFPTNIINRLFPPKPVGEELNLWSGTAPPLNEVISIPYNLSSNNVVAPNLLVKEYGSGYQSAKMPPHSTGRIELYTNYQGGYGYSLRARFIYDVNGVITTVSKSLTPNRGSIAGLGKVDFWVKNLGNLDISEVLEVPFDFNTTKDITFDKMELLIPDGSHLSVPNIENETSISDWLEKNGVKYPITSPNDLKDTGIIIKPGSLPGPNPGPGPGPNPDTGPGPVPPIDNLPKLDFTPLYISFKDKFPFCLPFDFINIIKSFDADPVAPVFNIPFAFAPKNMRS
ncbi:MAG: hypothetical protein ACRC68_14630, partial [Clostridium sp.]